MRLLLIRHAQTPANVDGSIATSRPGPGLTELGLEQARAIPDAVAGERIAAIYVSPLTRTSLTAEPLAEALGLPIVETEGLEEIEAGDLEGLTGRDAVWSYLGTVMAWLEGDLTRRIPGGQDGVAFFDRFDRALARIAAAHADDATVVVVSHGAAIRAWVAARGSNLGDEFADTRILDNTGIVVLNGSPIDGWVVETWQGDPVGGAALADPAASDPTGDAPL
jgi:broad specificity phosphatase PhoE